MRLRIVLAAAAVAWCALVPGQARADGRADLEKAHNAYVARRYDDAEERLRALLSSGELKGDPDAVADARMYLGAVLLAEKKDEEAARTFEQLISDKPTYTPDPLRVTLEAQDAFIDAKTRMRDKLAAMEAARIREAQAAQAKLDQEKQRQARRLAMLEELASTETIIEHHSRWIALVPFGAGQFQNGQSTEGWLFLIGEGLLAGGSVVATGFSAYYAVRAGQDYRAQSFTTSNAYSAASRIAAYTGNVLAGGLVLAAIGGVIHAEATFVPETVEKRKRALPQLSLRPIVGPTGVGLAGTF